MLLVPGASVSVAWPPVPFRWSVRLATTAVDVTGSMPLYAVMTPSAFSVPDCGPVGNDERLVKTPPS